MHVSGQGDSRFIILDSNCLSDCFLHHRSEMNGLLDSCDGSWTARTVYDSCGSDDSPDQTGYAPNNALLGSDSSEEWTHFVEGDRWSKHHQCSTSSGLTVPLNQSHLENDEQSSSAKGKAVESQSHWQVLRNSFPMVNTSEDAITGEPETLIQLLQKSSESPPLSSPALSDAASLWCCLLREPSGLRKPETSSCPSIKRGLHSSLRITENVSSNQNAPPAKTHPAETSGVPPRPPAGPLIQTKLLAPPDQRDGPSFLYQISRQWASKHNLRLQDRNHKKGFFF